MGKEWKGLRVGQLSPIVWTALLAPAAGTLPGVAARNAGAAGWLSTLIALPAVLLAGRAVWLLTNRGEEDLSCAYCRILGRMGGNVLIFIYVSWCVVLLALRLRLSSHRLLLAGRQTGTYWFYLPIILAVSVWLARGKPAVLARAASRFFPALVSALSAVTMLAVFQVRGQNLWPVWTQDVLPACEAAVSALGILCGGIYGGFLLGSTEQDGGWCGRAAGICLGISGVQAVILGNFGAQLTARLEDPFLALSKSVGVEGAFQRLEVLAAGILLFSDLTMIALLLLAGRRMMERITPAWPRGAVLAAGAVLAILGATVGFEDVYEAQRFERAWMPLGNLILGLCVPGGLCLLFGRTRNKRTSCAREG